MKIMGYILGILFIIGSLFLWFRTSDGSGLNNTFQIKIASLAIWLLFCLILFIIYFIVYFLINRK